MGATASQLPFLRADTLRFINLDPTVVILTPKTTQFVAGTRQRSDDSARTPQTFKIIWNTFGAGFAPTIAGGETRRFDFILIGTYDSLVEIGDFWNKGNQQNQIDYIFPFNGYEVKAGGTSHGADPNA